MKYYIRNGRRFVRVKSLKGMFYNSDGIFTENKTNKSIGICVHNSFEEIIIASLNVSKNPATYDVAESACKAAFPSGEGHIPSRKELYMAMEYKQYININNYGLWTSESRWGFAWIFGWVDGYVSSAHKGGRYYVLPFLTIKW